MTTRDLYKPILKKIYEEASKISLGDIKGIDAEEKKLLELIANKSDEQKGVYVVLIVSLATKILSPKQDVRLHQANMKGGYSGRSVDTRFVTPFLKSIHFPTNKESGWLTRSLEQNYPYNLSYRGKIRDIAVKHAFLSILDNIETKGRSAGKYLLYLFKHSIINREKRKIKLLIPSKGEKISIQNIIHLLFKHFNNKYKTRGASRLPVLAIHAIYSCLINQMERFKDKRLVPLEEHTSADKRSGAIADIEIKSRDGSIFEAVEIKHNISITPSIIRDSYNKFAGHPVERYYILTTAVPCVKDADKKEAQDLLIEIERDHGCQVVVNGIISSLNYYLRLVKSVEEFVRCYTSIVEKDSAIGLEHKSFWNKLASSIE